MRAMRSNAQNTPREGQARGQLGLWLRVQAIYDHMPDARRAAVIDPVTLRRFIGRQPPALYVNPGDRAPLGYAVITIAIDPLAPRKHVLSALAEIVDESLCLETKSPRHDRITPDDVKRFVLWYYQRAAGVGLKVLAIDEAERQGRPRTTRRADTGTSERAIAQAKARILSGVKWLRSRIEDLEASR